MELTFTRVLIETDTGLKVEASADTRIFFNPSEYQLERRVDWKETNNRGVDLPQLQFDKGGRRSLKMSLTFDTYERLTEKGVPEDVRKYTGQIAKLAEVDGAKKRPPVCTITWGPTVNPYAGLPFKGVLESLTQKFTMFLANGTPVRATLEVQFKEWEAPARQQRRNPRGSGSPLEPKRRVVREGDALWRIAAEEYGDPAHWRPIAAANNITAPRVLEPGTELIIPSI
jgi:nucleoid-associated protein YgaU